ncbi:MAG: hypothetical protein K8W52_30020 [Deltaproteobacteria bacterium]|nr:hypothetical protein [Deltaproteobacteria bacterium]
MTIELAPQLVSSIDGTVTVHAIALAERAPAPTEPIELTVTYQDRNGADHAIAAVDGTTDDAGAFTATIGGLTWDGTGTITATLLSGAAGSPPQMVGDQPIAASATFAVLDRTPPVVAITAPGPLTAGQDYQIAVHVTDEIGVSEVFFEDSGWPNNNNGNGGRQRATVIASGEADTTLMFRFTVPGQTPSGTTNTLYALASDLSGNQAAAAAITVTVQ